MWHEPQRCLFYLLNLSPEVNSAKDNSSFIDTIQDWSATFSSPILLAIGFSPRVFLRESYSEMAVAASSHCPSPNSIKGGSKGVG